MYIIYKRINPQIYMHIQASILVMFVYVTGVIDYYHAKFRFVIFFEFLCHCCPYISIFIFTSKLYNGYLVIV